jgi:hypothetical protein
MRAGVNPLESHLDTNALRLAHAGGGEPIAALVIKEASESRPHGRG